MKKILTLAAIAVGLTFGANASAATLANCSTTDITPTAQACVGFESGNLLNNANQSAQASALSQLGLTNWSGTVLETISPLNGAQTVNFSTVLSGITYIGLHFANGYGGPGNGTAFYRLDAGSSLSSIGLAYRASSNAVLYSTNVAAAVPEPATWAMMILGMGAVGFAMRNAKRKSDAKFNAKIERITAGAFA